MKRYHLLLASFVLLVPNLGLAADEVRFSRHVSAIFSRLGCNAGTCHGAVRGQNGFRLSLFAADPQLDYERLLRDELGGRRVNRGDPDASLLLLKATARVPHQGGKRTDLDSPEYSVLRRWIAAGAAGDDPDKSRVTALQVRPTVREARPGQRFPLRVEARFADGSHEDVTGLCSFESLDRQVATINPVGEVEVRGVGDTALMVRYRAEPALAMVVVPRPADRPFPDVAANNVIDRHVLTKLRRLNLPPAPLCDDATFLRRVSLDVAGELPAPTEVRAFLADKDAEKRTKKIDELLRRPGHAALWTLKFCDLLKAADFGVYADALTKETDAPRFQAWVRARLEENLPYDQFAERILTATSREGRSLEAWADEVRGLFEGATDERKDVALYRQRKTLDLYWLRGSAAGVPGALQVAHAFLGLRLECAQCHRHPHDVWRQDDLLSFANFFMRVRRPGFQGDNEKKFPELAALNTKLATEAKQLADQAKKLRETRGKQLDADAKKAKAELEKPRRELVQLEKQGDKAAAEVQRKRAEVERWQAAQAEYDKFLKEVTALERQSKLLPEVGRRILHAEVRHLSDRKDLFASVTSPLGTQSSKTLRLLGETKVLDLGPDQDPRPLLVAWLRRPDNPWFARAIVNRVWAHYFGRGLIDPPDNLSPFNPASHPELLKELCGEFIKSGYDLRSLHRTILLSRTYQQSSTPDPASRGDRGNYAFFAYRRLPGEVLLDALNQATGTTENMDMKYYHWPEQLKIVEIPYTPRNPFVAFMVEQFGRPPRNSAVQCDCERDSGASLLQVLSLANHPRVRQKVMDPNGLAARVLKEIKDDEARIEEVFLAAICRLPDDAERQACLKYLRESETPLKGVQGMLWGLLNTREFLLQH